MRPFPHRLVLGSALLFGTLACSHSASQKAPDSPPTRPETPDFSRIPRLEFNTLAAESNLPLFWREDANHNGVLEPSELDILTGPPRDVSKQWLTGQTFPPDFQPVYERLVELKARGWQWGSLPDAEKRRRDAVVAELRQGRPTLLRTDLRGLTAPEKTMLTHLQTAAQHIEKLYAMQKGVDGLEAQLPPDDLPGRALFHRNQGPWCEAPGTEHNPDCNAVPSLPRRRSGLYPASLQQSADFCTQLDQRPDARQLLDPFVVVREDAAGQLIPVPYPKAFGAEMTAVAQALDAAAQAVDGTPELALQAYLKAAALSFRTNDWLPADEAWAKMNAQNSRWYLRVAPDETQFDPCAHKGGFQFALARIDARSLQWQALLDPLKNELEQALASLAGPPYAARAVSFHLPDFIEITLNAGDSRSASGATIGESLPNWGPVAREGRGRTVAMTNIGNDADSNQTYQAVSASILCARTFQDFTTDPAPLLMSTVLHEAAHNLGPSSEYKVNGQTDGEAFGGPLAEMLEELKAQTAALWLADWLAARGTVTHKQAADAHLSDLLWSMAEVSGGMADPDGRSKPYGQLAAIQLGAFLEDGALVWKSQEKAANGQDVGCFDLEPSKLGASIAQLMKRVAVIKARGDKADAERMRKTWVETPGDWRRLQETIRTRWLRAPLSSYVYAVVVD